MPELVWQARAQGGYSTRTPLEVHMPPAGRCTHVSGCDREDTRRYLAGVRCPLHTPAAERGRPEPPTGAPYVIPGPETPDRHYSPADAGGLCTACGNPLPAALAGLEDHPACDPDMPALRVADRRRIAQRKLGR